MGLHNTMVLIEVTARLLLDTLIGFEGERVSWVKTTNNWDERRVGETGWQISLCVLGRRVGVWFGVTLG